MHLLYYAPAGTRIGKKLDAVLGHLIPAPKVERYHTFGELSRRLKKPRFGLRNGFIVASDELELQLLLGLEKLLDDIHFILIVPSRNAEALFRAHRLKPRFVTDSGDNPQLIADVVTGMLQRSRADRDSFS